MLHRYLSSIDDDTVDLQDTVILSRYLRDTSVDHVLLECSIQNKLGNNLVMIAGQLSENKHILAILLKYFTRIAANGHLNKIDTILHQKNNDGQNLMSIVMKKNEMGPAERNLVQLEAMVHEWDRHKFEICMLRELGANSMSSVALNCFAQNGKARKMKR